MIIKVVKRKQKLSISKQLKVRKKIDIPKDPKRIVVMAPTYAGGLKYLDANIVGVSDQVDQSPVLAKQFKDVDKVGQKM